MTGTFANTEIEDFFPSTIRGGEILTALMSSSTFRSVGVTAQEEVPVTRQTPKRSRSAPKRRLRGFVIAFYGQEVRVGFVQADRSIVEYMLPAVSLKKAGITEENQPFEMDEIEETADSEYSLTYRYRPMAPADSAVIDILDTDERLSKLRDAALRRFGNGSDH